MKALLATCCFVVFIGMVCPWGAAAGNRIQFPEDEGAHPKFQTEWWYVTGWLEESGRKQGFQITFFRSRNPGADGNPSAFAAKQLIFAHAALSDPRVGRLLRAERSARTGFGLAAAAESKIDLALDHWKLRSTQDGYSAVVSADSFAMDLDLKPTQPPLLNGVDGISQKSPNPAVTSFYYSLPHLQVTGTTTIRGKTQEVVGTAWLDHEWSNDYVDENAVGWDWLGVNLLDGGALMLFRMRRADGTTLWSGGTSRNGDVTKTHSVDNADWKPTEFWRSPRTGTEYPIAWRIHVDGREFQLLPLMLDQENDATGSVGILYWEGAVEVREAGGKVLGRGYLELTGYDRPARL